MKLSISDIKILKKEKRIGYVISGLIFFFFVPVIIIYFSNNPELSMLLKVFLFLILICLSFFVQTIVNKKVDQDLINNKKNIKVEEVVEKQVKIDYEVGSGSLHRPILGSLFPKIWGQDMTEQKKYILILKEDKLQIDQPLFEEINIGDTIELHYSNISELLLDIQLIKTK